jgi:hypothetical protein
MLYTKDAGYGRLMADKITYGGSQGKTFVVGKSALAYSSMIRQLFNSDADGVARYFATVDAAIGACTANAGDMIIVLPGHTETVTTTSIALDVAGVRVVGLGVGDLRPTFTFGAAAATIQVSAANISWENCRMVANFADVASAFTTAAAKGFKVINCDFLDTSSILNFLCCVTTSSTDNAADGLTFNGNYVYGLAATDGAVVSVLANLLRLQVCDNIVDKAATNNAGHMITSSSKILGGVRILRNVLTVVGASNASAAIFFTGTGATSSGVLGFNNVSSLDTTGAILMSASTGISPMQNYLSGAVDKSGTLNPTADDPA